MPLALSNVYPSLAHSNHSLASRARSQVSHCSPSSSSASSSLSVLISSGHPSSSSPSCVTPGFYALLQLAQPASCFNRLSRVLGSSTISSASRKRMISVPFFFSVTLGSSTLCEASRSLRGRRISAFLSRRQKSSSSSFCSASALRFGSFRSTSRPSRRSRCAGKRTTADSVLAELLLVGRGRWRG